MTVRPNNKLINDGSTERKKNAKGRWSLQTVQTQSWEEKSLLVWHPNFGDVHYQDTR